MGLSKNGQKSNYFNQCREVAESKAFAVTKIAKELLEVADCVANCKNTPNRAKFRTSTLRRWSAVKLYSGIS